MAEGCTGYVDRHACQSQQPVHRIFIECATTAFEIGNDRHIGAHGRRLRVLWRNVVLQCSHTKPQKLSSTPTETLSELHLKEDENQHFYSLPMDLAAALKSLVHNLLFSKSP